jgi:hypothetical protein
MSSGMTIFIFRTKCGLSQTLHLVSRMPERVTTLENQTEEYNSAIDKFGNDIRRDSKEEHKVGFEEPKPI